MSSKPKSVKTLKAKLDNIFSKYIRLRDSDEDGYCRCITCGASWHWKAIHAGHFRSRRYSTTRFDERNVHAQCNHCNKWGEGEHYIYGQELDIKYGEGTANELLRLSRQHKKFKTHELEEMINHYQSKLADLAIEKRQIV